jgi:hypothetical protein
VDGRGEETLAACAIIHTSGRKLLLLLRRRRRRCNCCLLGGYRAKGPAALVSRRSGPTSPGTSPCCLGASLQCCMTNLKLLKPTVAGSISNTQNRMKHVNCSQCPSTCISPIQHTIKSFSRHNNTRHGFEI